MAAALPVPNQGQGAPAKAPDAKRQKILAKMAKLNKQYEATLPETAAAVAAAPVVPMRPFEESVSLFERVVGLKDSMPPVMWNAMCGRLWMETYGEPLPDDAFAQPPENTKKRAGVEEPTTEGKEAPKPVAAAAAAPAAAQPPTAGVIPPATTGVAAQNAFDNVFKEAGNLLLGADSSAVAV